MEREREREREREIVEIEVYVCVGEVSSYMGLRLWTGSARAAAAPMLTRARVRVEARMIVCLFVYSKNINRKKERVVWMEANG